MAAPASLPPVSTSATACATVPFTEVARREVVGRSRSSKHTSVGSMSGFIDSNDTMAGGFGRPTAAECNAANCMVSESVVALLCTERVAES